MKLLEMDTTACDGSDFFMGWILWLLGVFTLGLVIGWLLKSIYTCGINTKKEVDVKQDLTKIEGIGGELEILLNNKGVISYKQLSNVSLDFLEAILLEAGPAYITHRVMIRTWPAQANLANLGEWEELKDWQDLLKEGS